MDYIDGIIEKLTVS